MSMVTQLIAAITNAERQLDEQIAQLSHYLSELDNVSKQIDSALSGSGNRFDQQMIEKTAATKKQVEDTIQKLQIAKAKLSQVKAI